ncbi:MAG: MAPEG family protein [Deltaproteobacteria bacterium]|nr:MAPEG family protein [Deltaproteobacteria bacterium]
MKPELFWLAATATMTGLFWLPYILNRTIRMGIPGVLLTPGVSDRPAEAEWAQRAKKAHYNAVENLVVFASLVTVTQLAGVSNHATAMACAVYFWARLGHFIALTLGIPYLRTLIWTAGWVAQMVLAWQVLMR